MRLQRRKADRHLLERQPERNQPVHLAQHMQRRGHDLRPDAVARHDDEMRAVGHEAELPFFCGRSDILPAFKIKHSSSCGFGAERACADEDGRARSSP
jgi:hypothetical protein